MTEETTQTEFTFLALGDKAKEKVRAKHCEHMDWDWWDSVYADFKERGAERGFNIEDMRFSGFWSQGDGALWTGRIRVPTFISYHISDTDPDHHRYQILLMLLEEDWLDHYVDVSQIGFHYSHSGCMRFSSDIGSGAVFDLEETDAAVLEREGVLKGANVYQLWQGIDGEGLTQDLDELLVQKAREYADELYVALEEEYESLTSDEAIADDCYINGRRFEEDGTEIF
jgi:hypothetical protein